MPLINEGRQIARMAGNIRGYDAVGEGKGVSHFNYRDGSVGRGLQHYGQEKYQRQRRQLRKSHIGLNNWVVMPDAPSSQPVTISL